MKKIMVRTILCGALCALILSCGSTGGSGGGAAKAEAAPLAEITGLTWDVQTFSDQEANNGSSTVEMTTDEATGAYNFQGAVTNQYQYGFAGAQFIPGDETTLEALKRAKAFSFNFQGDGQRYEIKILTSNITDHAYYNTRIPAPANATDTTIQVSSLRQPSDWGTKKPFVQANAEQIQFQTTHNGKPGPFDFTVADLKLYE